MDEQALIQRLLHLDRLRPWRRRWLPKDHLSYQAPFFGDAECLLYLVIDDRVIVLQIGAKTRVGQSRPDDDLRVLVSAGYPAKLLELLTWWMALVCCAQTGNLSLANVYISCSFLVFSGSSKKSTVP